MKPVIACPTPHHAARKAVGIVSKSSMILKLEYLTEKPLLIGRQVLQKHCCVQDEISTSTETNQGDEDRKANPVRCCSSRNRENRAYEQREVEGIFTSDNIGAEPPEESTTEHAHVNSNRHGLWKRVREFITSRRGNDRLQ
jgi:hypothetical protein